jgi:hypothetical protein
MVWTLPGIQPLNRPAQAVGARTPRGASMRSDIWNVPPPQYPLPPGASTQQQRIEHGLGIVRDRSPDAVPFNPFTGEGAIRTGNPARQRLPGSTPAGQRIDPLGGPVEHRNPWLMYTQQGGRLNYQQFNQQRARDRAAWLAAGGSPTSLDIPWGVGGLISPLGAGSYDLNVNNWDALFGTPQPPGTAPGINPATGLPFTPAPIPPAGAPPAGAQGGGIGQIIDDMISGGLPEITTGIDVGPVYQPGEVQGAVDLLQQPATAEPLQTQETRSIGQGAQSSLAQMLRDATRATGSRQAVDFARNAAMENARRELESERARAQSGIDFGQVSLGDYTSRLNDASRIRSALIRLLGGLA